jgi:hypothetical protein
VRVEAASLAGQPVYFNVLEQFDEPWTRPGDADTPWLSRWAKRLDVALLIAALVAAPLIARRNLRRGTGDRTGAVRLAVTIFGLSIASWLLWADHTFDVGSEVQMVLVALGMSLLLGVWAGLTYLGLEPYVRRLLPEAMISWTRLLMGRFSDPRVGRDVLSGAVAGTLVIVVQRIEWLAPTWFGVPPKIPFQPMSEALDGGRRAWAAVIQPGVFSGPLLVLLVLTASLYLLPKRWLAILVSFVVFALVDDYLVTEGPVVIQLAAGIEVILVWGIILFILVRFGLLAMVTTFFFFNMLQQWPLILDGSVWFRGTSFVGVALLAAVAAVAARISVGHRAPPRLV